MSLINQVLRDLETRKRREQQPPGEIRAVTYDGRNLPRLFFVLAGLALLAVSLYLLWTHLQRPASQPVASTARAKTAPSLQRAVRPVAPQVAAAVTNPVIDATRVPALKSALPAASNPQRTGANTAGVSLLAATPLADHSGFRLEFNHMPGYRLFTLTDPDRIVLDVNDVTTASDFTRGVTLPAGIKTTRFSLEPQKRMRVVFEIEPDVTANVANVHDATLLLTFAHAAVAPATASRKVASNPVSTDSASAGDMLKTLRNTPEDLARDAYKDGLTRLDAGDATGAERRFRDALQRVPGFDPARVALARLLAQTGRNSDAETVLAQGIKAGQNKPRFARLDANLLVQQGALADAMKALESALPDIHAEPEHYAFMAALAQRSGDNARAAKLYQQVLEIRPDNGVWWMGLGISLEQLKQPQAALNAYRHAQQSGDLNPDVAQFVNQRIKALGP
ncbi:MAG TPA: tetratricopeptide repeat protein [Gammaproteobacteria bacterium]|nr:tetratricopeptide repeat protein [Gammaproteobacteria bacterium]